ncbi:aldo-keto reductase-2 [Coleophoma cylindrospora]|uniref:Aldo-keto reductase-2 n=1 Tax=Coleophoma cylindrospora TaxID=1849047 RepID=A0A3D8S8V8_9HELO|nr:aldo-keto reductase-2 [Coleophoma cylindrospora]
MSPQLPTRQLGKDGPYVCAMGFGTMGLSVFYGVIPSDSERLAFLDQVFARGETFWDSADIYGDSEDLLGKWFKQTGKRDEVFLATKFANSVTAEGEWVLRSDPEYVKLACEKSLSRLGIDCIDLYYCHRVDQKTPIEKTVQAMVELKEAGKIKYLGLSECSAATLRRACAVHHISAIQMEYNPFETSIEDPQINVLQTARELGVAVVIYSPLGHGILTGQYKSSSDFEADDFRHTMPQFSGENLGKNLKLVDELKARAAKKGVTVGQLALAWEMAQGDDIIPIPGTKKVKYLEENLGALNIKLSEEEIKEIRAAVDACTVYGERYSEEHMKNLYGDTPPL